MNVIRVFWRRCQEHKAKAVPHSPIPACPCSLRWQPGEGGSLNTQLLLFCLGTAWGLSLSQHSALDLCPSHMFFPLKPGCRITPNASRTASPALHCPGVTELLSDRAGTSGHLSAALQSCERTFHVVEHPLVVPWPRTHVQPPPPEAPLPRRTGAPLPHQLLILLSSLLIFSYSYNSAAMSEPDMVCQGGWGGNSVSALVNTCLNPASPLFEIYSIS